MVQGLGFLSKKSWHTKNLANQEKVWVAEQRKEAEAQKTHELAKQIQQEREQEELEKISGKKSTTLDRGIDWMYQGGGGGANGDGGNNHISELARQDAEKRAEEFLMGKEYVGDGAAQGDFDNGDQDQGIHSVLKGDVVVHATATNVDAQGPTATTTTTSSFGEPSVKDRNEEFRRRVEDPMFHVSQKQHEKEVRHEKTKQLYEKVVGVVTNEQKQKGDMDSNDSDSRRDKKKRGKKHHKKKHHKKSKKSSSNSNSRHRDYDVEESSEEDRRHSRRRRSPSSSPVRHAKRSRRSPSADSYERSKSRRDDRRSRHRHHDGDDDNYNEEFSVNRQSRRENRSSDRKSSRRSSSDRHYTERERGRDKEDRGRDYDRHRDDRYNDREKRSNNLDRDRHDKNSHSEQKASPSQQHDQQQKLPSKKEGYGLKGSSSSGPIDRNQLGPNQDLLNRKRNEREAEKQRMRQVASSRRNTTAADRARALQEMQSNAKQREREQTRSRQDTQRQSVGDHEEDVVTRAGASFIKEMTRNVHGIGKDSQSLSARVAQNRHTNQKLHDSFL